MRHRLFAGVLFSVLWWGTGASHALESGLVVYTENYPPFNFENEDGTVGGLATERVRQVLDAAGFDYEIRVVPWARAVNNTQSQDNALIYTLTRTPKREPSYHWLVPLSESNFYLFVRREETREITPEGLSAGLYTASCVSGDLTCELLTWAGIPEENIIPITESGTGDFRMVVAGRADIYITDLAVNDRLRRAEGFDPRLTKPAMKLQGKSGFYLASGPNLPKETSAKIKAAHQALVDQGAYHLVNAAQGLQSEK